jgi:hypothetical protein
MFLEELPNKITAFFDNLVNSLSSGGEGEAKFIKALQSLAKVAVAAFKAIFISLPKALIVALPKIAWALIKGLTKLIFVALPKALLKGFFGAFKFVFYTLPKFLYGGFFKLIGGAFKFIFGLPKKIFGVFRSILSGIKDFFVSLIKGAIRWFMTFLEGIPLLGWIIKKLRQAFEGGSTKPSGAVGDELSPRPTEASAIEAAAGGGMATPTVPMPTAGAEAGAGEDVGGGGLDTSDPVVNALIWHAKYLERVIVSTFSRGAVADTGGSMEPSSTNVQSPLPKDIYSSQMTNWNV